MRYSITSALFGCTLVVGPALAADFESRIIGGCNSEVSSHEWMVAVAHKLNTDEYNSQFCGATLIHESWAVTAAHCMYDQNNVVYQPENLELYIGTTVLSTGTDLATHHDVSEIYVHPSYTELASTSHNDIALLKLTTPSNQSPARLATIKPSANYDALTVGWGRRNAIPASSTDTTTDNDDYPQTLQEVNVTTFDNANCYSNLIDSHLCAGELAGGEDSCAGDSGGPLLLSSQGQDTLIGVVSYGFGCAQPQNLGVYTSVPSYLTWIAETTRDAVTNISDVPAPTALSESFSDFTSVCTPNKTDTSTFKTTSGGGAVGALFLVAGLIGVSRRRVQSALKPTISKHK